MRTPHTTLRSLTSTASPLAGAWLALLVLTADGRAQGGLGLFQQPPTGPVPAVTFDPTEVCAGQPTKHYVPLSEYRSTYGAGNPVVLNVKAEILQYLETPERMGTLRVAVKGPGGVDYIPRVDLTVDPETGTVSFAPSLQGNVVAISTLFQNEFPIVTHWNPALNDDHGGQEPGATGAPNSVGSSSSTYMWDTANYALLSDGSGLFDNDLVPGPEKYIGENYAVGGVSNLVALYLSDLHRAATGYPIAHRNYDSEANEELLFENKLDQDVPIFQIMHAYIVPFEDPLVAGKEQSLASFVLPPGWHPTEDPTYPILFLGFYDVHASTFDYSLGHLETLGDLANEGYSAVGIFWNGGGAFACQTMHESAHDNAALLLTEKAPLLVGADPDKLLITGGSRGGTTGLEIASTLPLSPTAELYVIAANPQLAHGETIRDFTNSTYLGAAVGIAAGTGYKDSWKQSWKDPDTGFGYSGRVLAAHNYTGVEPPAGNPEAIFGLIDATYSPIAVPRVQGLAANRTKLILRAATHDNTRPMSLTARYVDALRNNVDVFGIPDPVEVRLELSYRWGHGNAVGLPGQPDELTILRQLAGGPVTYVHQDENVYYRRVDNTNFDTPEEFFPTTQPLILEMPLWTARNEPSSVPDPEIPPTWTVTGEPGTQFFIKLDQVYDSYWMGAPLTLFQQPSIPIVFDTLPTGPAEMTSMVYRPDLLPLPQEAGSLWASFRVTLYFTVDEGGPEPVLYVASTGAQAAPSYGNETVLRVSTFSGPAYGTEDQSRCGGLSSDAQFP